jgi:hypothetical protein
MTRRRLLAWAAVAASARAQNSTDRMGAAWDLLYQALELLSAHASPAEVARAIGFLKRALDQYASFGDAHYYRALCLARLKTDAATQGRALEAARRYNSEALRDRRDPFTLAVPKLHENLAGIGQKWALVVGISQFQPDAGAESLGFAASDATAFAELLRDPNAGRFPANQVFALTNAQATTANIKARLNTIAAKAKPEDIVVVYLSTHGSPRADDLRDVSYLYTYDTDVTSRDQIFGTALPMVEVSGIVSTRCVAQRTVVVLDTCHSGESAAGQAASQGDFDRLRAGAGRYIISSCEADQKSYEIAGHGYFTASLISRLRERHGCIRLNDLFASVQKDVSETVMKKHNRPQRPVMAKSDDAAEIVLGAAQGASGEPCVPV